MKTEKQIFNTLLHRKGELDCSPARIAENDDALSFREYNSRSRSRLPSPVPLTDGGMAYSRNGRKPGRAERAGDGWAVNGSFVYDWEWSGEPWTKDQIRDHERHDAVEAGRMEEHGRAVNAALLDRQSIRKEFSRH